MMNEFESGHLPTIDDVGKFMDSHVNRDKEEWYTIKDTSAEAALRKDHMKLFKSGNPMLGESGSQLRSNNQNANETQRKKPENSVFITSKRNIVAGGTGVVLNALAAYLRYLEGTARDDWQEYVFLCDLFYRSLYVWLYLCTVCPIYLSLTKHSLTWT